MLRSGLGISPAAEASQGANGQHGSRCRQPCTHADFLEILSVAGGLFSCASNVLGTDADSDQARGHMLQSGNVHYSFELPGRLCRSRILEYLLEQLMRVDLHKLGRASRKLATLLDLCEHSFSHASLAQWVGQQIGRRHRILDREINSDSTSRGHCMGRIANAE